MRTGARAALCVGKVFAPSLLTPRTMQLLHTTPRIIFFSAFIPLLPEGFEVFRRQGDPRHHVALSLSSLEFDRVSEVSWALRFEYPRLHSG